MSSHHRTSDAEVTAPYLTHAISHHGQVTLVPPENAGRIRKPRKAKGRNRNEGNGAADDEVRFNTGVPKNMRLPIAVSLGRGRRQQRGARQGRGDDTYPGDISIPDYPPPPFSEAISTIATSPSQSTATYQTARDDREVGATTLPQNAPTLPHLSSALGITIQSHKRPELHTSSASAHNVSSQESSSAPSPPSSPDTLSSFENIEKESCFSWEEARLQGLSLEERVERERLRREAIESLVAPTTALAEIHARRNGQRAVLSDSDDEAPTPPSSPTKRKNFAAFKAFSSSLAGSSSSMPSSSTLSLPLSRSSPFLRSSTSLMKFSGGSSPPAFRSENIVSRKLFPSKGKEKDKERMFFGDDNEPLDSWELVQSRPISATPTLTPTPFTEKTPRNTSLPQSSPSPTPEAATASLRDRKVLPEMVTQSQQTRLPSSPPPIIFPSSNVPHASTSAVSHGEKSAFRSLPPPLPKQAPRIPPAEPKIAQISVVPVHRVQRAPHEIPLPPTPSDITFMDFGQAAGIPAPAAVDFSARKDVGEIRSHREFLHVGTSAIPKLTTAVGTRYASPSPVRYQSSLLAARNTRITPPRPSSPLSVSTIPPSPTRAGLHYPGRPLPLPPRESPLALTPTKPIWATPIPAAGPKVPQNGACCPEGDLIDFGDNSSDEGNDGLWSVAPVRGDSLISEHVEVSSLAVQPAQSHLPSPSASFSSLSVAPPTHFTALSPSTSTRTLDIPASATSSSSSLTLLEPERQVYSEYTDLDALVARLEEDSHSGADYDTLVTLSEFAGPANASQVDETGPISALLGKVEVQRRRLTKDGRVKLKLTLLGAAVDKCRICISQFKLDELARLSTGCQHAFHERCLQLWLKRSRTCPLCRAPLDASDA